MKWLFFLISITYLHSISLCQDILYQSIEAHGGLEQWENVKYIKSKYIQHINFLEQSERHEGPYLSSYQEVSEIKHVSETKLHQDLKALNVMRSDWGSSSRVLMDNMAVMNVRDRSFPLPQMIVDDMNLWLLLDPINLLLQTKNSKDYRISEVTIHSIPHYEISNSASGYTYKLYVNANTLLVAEASIETYLPYDFYYAPWGKFETKVMYSMYSLFSKGLKYPRQWDIYKMGLPYSRTTFVDLVFDPKVDQSVFKISDEIKDQIVIQNEIKIENLPIDEGQSFQVSERVHGLGNIWNVAWVEQSEGIIVLEAPFSSGYSSKVIEFLKRKYPNKEVKGVVMTSDAWPHIGGGREYFAHEIPVYCHPLNKTILTKLFNANYETNPDRLHNEERVPNFNLVNRVVTLEDKEVPIVIAPANGEGGERMLLIYFPKQKILYASDLLQKLPDGTYALPHYALEVKNAVEKYQWDVESYFAMHVKATPWKSVLDFLEKYH